jgi:UDP-N-acetyl-2-amino-2-deoxyglucuronate dehydrogenase
MLVANSHIWATRIQTIDALLSASAGGRDEIYYLATVCQVGLEPARVSVSPNPEYPICATIAESGHFGLSFLATDQGDLISRCISLDRERPDKIQGLGVAFERTGRGTPILTDCIQAVECRVERVWDCGDHRTIIGRVIERRVSGPRHDHKPHRFEGTTSRARAWIKEALCRSRFIDAVEIVRDRGGRVPDIEGGTRGHLVAPLVSPTGAPVRQRAQAPPGVCLVGCGFWGSVHALEMKRLGTRLRRYFASRDLARAQDFTRRFAGEAAFAGLEAAIADPRVHAVILALPHHLHAESALAALRAGKHVLVEKPIALSVEEGQDVVRAADDRGLCLAVAEQYRLSPLVQTTRRLIRQGELGRVNLVRASAVVQYRPNQPWKLNRDTTGGGVLIDVAIHHIDVLRFWFGEPEEVWAGAPQLDRTTDEGEKTVVATLVFPGGPIASVQVSWASVGPTDPCDFELFGDRGCLQLRYRRPSLSLTRPLSNRHWANRARAVLPWRILERVDRFLPRSGGTIVRVSNEDLIGGRALIDDFVRAITTGSDPAVPGRDGLRDLEIVCAGYEAMRLRHSGSAIAGSDR